MAVTVVGSDDFLLVQFIGGGGGGRRTGMRSPFFRLQIFMRFGGDLRLQMPEVVRVL